MSRYFVLVFSFVFSLALSYEAQAIQTAIVSVDKAIVYSDVEMTSAIGYVRQGRQLKVGNQARRGGTILPIVVAGRIAYIRARDVAVSDNPSALVASPQGPKLREHEIDIPMGEVKDDLTENNYLVLNLGQYFDSDDRNEGTELEDGERVITSFSAMFEHRPIIYDYSWDIGLGYYSLRKEFFNFQTLTIEGNIYYSLLETGLLDFQVYGGIALSGDIRITSKTADLDERGSMWGYQYGAAAKIAPRQKWGLVLKAGIQRMNPVELDGLDKVEGVHLSAGIAYQF